jgi:hypothetical protein
LSSFKACSERVRPLFKTRSNDTEYQQVSEEQVEHERPPTDRRAPQSKRMRLGWVAWSACVLALLCGVLVATIGFTFSYGQGSQLSIE